MRNLIYYLNLFIGIYTDRGTKIISFIILLINRTYKNLKSSLRTEIRSLSTTNQLPWQSLSHSVPHPQIG